MTVGTTPGGIPGPARARDATPRVAAFPGQRPDGVETPAAPGGRDGDPGPLVAGLFDDAALFPPAATPMIPALLGHLGHRAAAHAGLVGPFVCAAPALPELKRALDGLETEGAHVDGFELALTVPAGPAALPASLAAVAADGRLSLRTVEVPVGPAEVDLALGALRAELPPGVTAYLEVPLDPGGERRAVYRALAASPHRIKIRTGGQAAGAFPAPAVLAAAIVDCARLGLAFKCTAGLHHAVRHSDRATGHRHHGFLNALLATAAAVDGAPEADVEQVLALEDGPRLAAQASALSAAEAGRIRDTFTSLGTCSIAEPVADLTTLGLLPTPS